MLAFPELASFDAERDAVGHAPLEPDPALA
jgi:hypothetical protein